MSGSLDLEIQLWGSTALVELGRREKTFFSIVVWQDVDFSAIEDENSKLFVHIDTEKLHAPHIHMYTMYM